ncbi:V-type ATP synthase subunit E [Hominifimenecus sp. rT4P-3]|uniref:V-type ATP synthase subunit E n=1 Tax=Hominifimenecus sp. rT4P-3 TaxID=3242979 RepID=UPI003DA46D84
MTTQEKLQHFYEVSVENAKTEAEEAVKEYEQVLEASLEEHRQARLRQAEMERKAEADNAKRQVNKALSAEQLRIKRRLSNKQEKLKEKLFLQVAEKLNAFRETPEYESYLVKKIEEAKNFAGEDTMVLTIGAGDAALAESLAKKGGHPVEVAAEDFGGGLQAVIPSKNILIDNAFSSLIAGEKEEFTFDGRILHD